MDTNIFNIFYQAYLAFINSAFFLYVKILSAFVTLVLFIDIILLFSKRIRSDIRMALYGQSTMKFKKSKYIPRWEAIRARLGEGSIASGKFAVIEADKMLDEALGIMGYAGKSTEEEIAQVKPGQLVGIDELRSIHTLHDRILEDPTHETNLQEITTALDFYERVLRGVGMID